MQDVLEVIRHEAADVIVTGPHQAGGLLAMKKAAIIAEAAGLPINRHAVGECGVGAVAGLHVCATLPNLTDGNQTHHQMLVDDVLETPLEFDAGKLTVPTAPGPRRHARLGQGRAVRRGVRARRTDLDCAGKPDAMNGIEISGLTKVFPNGVTALETIDLSIAHGEFMVLVGPSGCGKSTLLRLIAGLEQASGGRIEIGGNDVTGLPPQRRDIAMVFQNYALYPHMSVDENLAFGLRLRKTPKQQIQGRVADVARTLGLENLLRRRPAQLSGGQRQRVAMGRAMVREPTAFLMDEPLSNLDAKLRVAMRAELSRLHERLGVTTVYVTHDQVEAMTLGDRVAVMRDGVVQQCDTPERLFRHPVNAFVATFIGSPSMNLLEAEIEDGEVRFAEHRLPLPAASRPAGVTGPVLIGLRPTVFSLAQAGDAARLSVAVEVIENLGDESLVIFGVDQPRGARTADADSLLGEAIEDTVLLADDRRTMVTARVDGRHALAVGDRVEFAVDTQRIHFFDRDGGTALEVAGG